jgi:hypothetical protein
MINIIIGMTPLLLKVVAILVMVLSFLVVARKTKEKENIQKKYEESIEAILFLLETEDNHCRNNEENFNKTLRTTMRKYTKIGTNWKWSGKFSKANCELELQKLKNKKSNSNFSIEIIQNILLKSVK